MGPSVVSFGFARDVHFHGGPEPIGPFGMRFFEGFRGGGLRDGTAVFDHGFEPQFGGLFGVGVRLFERVVRGITAGEVRDDDPEGMGLVAGFDSDGVAHGDCLLERKVFRGVGEYRDESLQYSRYVLFAKERKVLRKRRLQQGEKDRGSESQRGRGLGRRSFGGGGKETDRTVNAVC